MNKNLKKVISSVAALSMVASSVAAFAATFPDVASDASYAQAVQELSALDVISGYDDGTFGPDKLVTRAEITKMIVDALAERSQAEASVASTKFADVSADHWAKGYINQGVADGFIAGMSDTEFAPDENVTFVQAQKMLVSAIGYETYAAAQGGWPTGYKTYAASLDITEGVSGIADNTELTRAQVAQMIDNAMDAPLCVIYDWKTEWNGTQTPQLEVRDGKNGRAYETLFTEKHDAYKVFGRVTDNGKGGTLNADEVSFRVEKSDNFDDVTIKAANATAEQMYVGDTDAREYLNVYAEALIQKNDDDEYTILSIVPAAANKSVTVNSEDFDSSKSTEQALYFYPAGTSRNSVKYKLADEVKIYVNGIESDGTLAELLVALAATDTASVTLQKETEVGSTSTAAEYSIITVTTYGTAIVESVTDKSNEIIIYFDESSVGKTKMTIDKDDETKEYTFTLDGAAIDPTELQEDDVLNIAYDVEDFAASNFYNVIVTRNVVEGVKCTSVKTTDGVKEYTMGGTKYKAAEGMDFTVEISTEYTLNLDHFGRIARIDETASAKNYGILKNIYKKAGGDYMAQVITKTGAEEEYKIEKENLTKGQTILFGDGTPDNDGVTYGGSHTKVANYPNQVIDYTVSSANKITIKNSYKITDAKDAVGAEYKASGDKIGSIKLSDASVILSVEDADVKDSVSVVSSLSDGANYTAYGFGKSSADSTYRFVIITAGESGFDSTTQMAIFNGAEVVDDDDRTDAVAYNLIVDGEEQQYILDEDYDAYDEDDFAEGDAIMFAVNAEGYIDTIKPLMAVVTESGAATETSYKLFDKYTSFSSFFTKATGTNVAKDIVDVAALTRWIGDVNTDDDEVEFFFGPVVNKNGNYISIGTVDTTTDAGKVLVDYDEAEEINYKEAKIYTYDYAASSKNSRVLLDEGIASTPDLKAAKVEDTDVLNIADADVKDEVVFALVRAIDGDAQEIYLILSSDN